MAELGLGRHPTTTNVAADDGVDLAGVLAILARQWFVVVAVTALFVGAAVAYVATTPKTWRAQTRVLLDPRDKQLVGNDLSRSGGSPELGWVETRVELVKAHPTLARVVEREKLADDAEVAGAAKPSEPAADAATLADRAVRGLADMIVVDRPKENSLIDVGVTSRDPEKAARLSRAVADAFVESLASAKVEQIEQANRLLAAQVDEMRRKMQQAEAKVEEYKRTNGIATTRGSLVDEETLRQSNENLIAARIRSQEARERFEHLRDAMRKGDIDSLGQSDGAGAQVISRLKLDVANAQRRKTEVEQLYGPRHPRTQAAATDLERAQTLVKDELKSLVATAEVDWQIARANEENLQRNLDRAQTRLADTSQATVALQELINEANARRELYKSFVSRMEETNLQKKTQVSDAVVVSPAQVPQKPFAPRATLALALAGVAGLGCGLSLALYRGRAALVRHRRRAAEPVAATVAAAPAPIVPAAAATVVPPASSVDPVPELHPVAPNDRVHLEGRDGHVREQPLGEVAPRSAAAATPPAAEPPPAAVVTPPPAPIEPAVVPSVAEPPAPVKPAAVVPPTVVAAEPTAPVVEAAVPAPLPPIAPVVETTPVVETPPPPKAAALEPSPAVAEPVAAAPSPKPAAASTAAPASKPAARPRADGPRRVDLVMLPERIARLGRPPGPGTGIDGALVETADGRVDAAGLAMLGRLSGELGFAERPSAALLFGDTVPAAISAGLAYGLARAEIAAGRRALILDFAEGRSPFAAVFDAAPHLAAPDRLLDFPDFEVHVDAHDVTLARGSIDAPVEAVGRFVGAALRDHARVLVHLGSEPSAALLFDVAECVDRAVLIAEAERLDESRLASEIEVMSGLIGGFDRILALSSSASATEPTAPRAGARRLRRPADRRGETGV